MLRVIVLLKNLSLYRPKLYRNYQIFFWNAFVNWRIHDLFHATDIDSPLRRETPQHHNAITHNLHGREWCSWGYGQCRLSFRNDNIILVSSDHRALSQKSASFSECSRTNFNLAYPCLFSSRGVFHGLRDFKSCWCSLCRWFVRSSRQKVI